MIDDLDDDGTISNDEWDAYLSGGGNDQGDVGYLFEGFGGGTGVLYATAGATFTVGQNVTAIRNSLDNNFEADVSAVICFTPGTLIATPHGQQPVEFLQAGDLVITADNGVQPIRWVGSSKVSGARLYAKPHLRPIKISKGALGNDLPEQDMWVSPQHRMHLTSRHTSLLLGEPEVLVPAKSLINDQTILVDHSVKSVDYIHILFDQHELVFANSALSESFFPGINALKTIDGPAQCEVFQIFPDLVQFPNSFGNLARPSASNAEAMVLAHEIAKTVT